MINLNIIILSLFSYKYIERGQLHFLNLRDNFCIDCLVLFFIIVYLAAAKDGYKVYVWICLSRIERQTNILFNVHLNLNIIK